VKWWRDVRQVCGKNQRNEHDPQEKKGKDIIGGENGGNKDGGGKKVKEAHTQERGSGGKKV